MEKPTKPAGKAFRQSKNMRTTRFCGFITMSDPPSNKKTALGNFPKAELRGARCALAEKEGFENSGIFHFTLFLRYVFSHVSTFVSTFCFFIIMSANLFDIVSDTSFFLVS